MAKGCIINNNQAQIIGGLRHCMQHMDYEVADGSYLGMTMIARQPETKLTRGRDAYHHRMNERMHARMHAAAQIREKSMRVRYT